MTKNVIERLWFRIRNLNQSVIAKTTVQNNVEPCYTNAQRTFL